jgi:hypothetical protein
MVTIVFRILFGYFYSLDWFEKLKNVYQYIENNPCIKTTQFLVYLLLLFFGMLNTRVK